MRYVHTIIVNCLSHKLRDEIELAPQVKTCGAVIMRIGLLLTGR